jgi:UDP:flavonoid glycosyltransferase YjiC (YdhE family)
MKIFMATYGSRGDVQPLVALALGLKARGHQIILAGPPEWQSWVTALGCPYTPLGSDLRPFLCRVEAAHRLTAGAAFHKLVMGEAAAQFKRLPAMIAGADLTIGASLCLALPSVAEALSIPYRYIAFTPQMLPSGAHPCPVFRRQHLPAWVNRLGWRLDLMLQKIHLLPPLNRHRRRLGLPPLKDYWDHLLGTPLLLACDAALSAVPADVRRPVVQTGYLHLKAEQGLPAEQAAWLAAGPRPLYAGFGSMPPADARRWVPMVVDAARALGQRLILKVDAVFKGILPPSSDLLVGASFSHAALFPRTRAVIHHGGAGTTATAARSGIPQIIVPHILDQFYWGERVYRRGLGPAPIWRTRLTENGLRKAIAIGVGDCAMAHQASAVGRQIRKGASLTTAAKILESLG